MGFKTAWNASKQTYCEWTIKTMLSANDTIVNYPNSAKILKYPYLWIYSYFTMALLVILNIIYISLQLFDVCDLILVNI